MTSPSTNSSPLEERLAPGECVPSEESRRPVHLNAEFHARIAKAGGARASTYESAMKALQRIREQRGAGGS